MNHEQGWSQIRKIQLGLCKSISYKIDKKFKKGDNVWRTNQKSNILNERDVLYTFASDQNIEDCVTCGIRNVGWKFIKKIQDC